MKKLRNPILWFSAVCLVSSLTACGQKKEAEMPNMEMPVQVLEIQPQSVPVLLETPGQTAGSSEVEVRSRVSGILEKKNYTEGAYVKKGTVLFTLETDSAQQAYKSAMANVASQKALLEQAQTNEKRVSALVKQNALSRRDGDDAKATLNTAKAAYDAAVAQSENSKLNVDYGVIRAPISGYTSSETRSVGSLVSPQEILTKISVINPIYVNFSFSDGDLAKLRNATRSGEVTSPTPAGLQVALTLPDGTEYPTLGRINFTDKIISATTGTVRARAVFDNPTMDLLPGSFVRVSLRGAMRNDAIIVPQRAISSGIQGKSVWVLTAENTFEPRPVTTGDNIGTNVIVTKGLQAGDRVILDNLIKLPQLPPKSKVKPMMVTLEEFYQSLAQAASPAAAPAKEGAEGAPTADSAAPAAKEK
ncbi:efflux RND transporter periplasmic adaptor subunit [Hydromonas duriensis]|uniref:Membrane fusion protein (Multidrug efflux system) n=1 Tax=Hydromonas duriensis TaxID=1527608 RepID=A0A4V3DJW1_9BURK|nr:efflux RND transporter periplasmic adaptor subunit [Hydromonas duriensis]TDR31670.1 membrane fusion protein (multidrug efflux system) [Hydromonas duriensis]